MIDETVLKMVIGFSSFKNVYEFVLCSSVLKMCFSLYGKRSYTFNVKRKTIFMFRSLYIHKYYRDDKAMQREFLTINAKNSGNGN